LLENVIDVVFDIATCVMGSSFNFSIIGCREDYGEYW